MKSHLSDLEKKILLASGFSPAAIKAHLANVRDRLAAQNPARDIDGDANR